MIRVYDQHFAKIPFQTSHVLPPQREFLGIRIPEVCPSKLLGGGGEGAQASAQGDKGADPAADLGGGGVGAPGQAGDGEALAGGAQAGGVAGEVEHLGRPFLGRVELDLEAGQGQG